MQKLLCSLLVLFCLAGCDWSSKNQQTTSNLRAPIDKAKDAQKIIEGQAEQQRKEIDEATK